MRGSALPARGDAAAIVRVAKIVSDPGQLAQGAEQQHGGEALGTAMR
jgi:hypothetical protein